MKRLLLTVSGLLAADYISTAQTICQWTFEGHAIAPSTSTSYGYSPADIGNGDAAVGFHLTPPTPPPITVFSGPVGNGSSQSFGANNWAVGDFWVFGVISTVGKTGIRLSWDQISSSDGPGLFRLQYSLEAGGIWTDAGSDYSVLANTGANTWNSSTYVGASHYSVDLSSIAALKNQPTVYFRLVDVGTISAGGGSITIAGMNQVDNFLVAVPEPPLVSARPAPNKGGKNPPNGKQNTANPDGFFQLLAEDDHDPNPQIFVMDWASDFVAGPFANGEVVKITVNTGAAPNQKPMGGVAHISLTGTALIYATDSDGNSSAPAPIP